MIKMRLYIFIIIILLLICIIPILSIIPLRINTVYHNRTTNMDEEYDVSHQTYDGTRLAYYIRHQLVTPKITVRQEETKYHESQFMKTSNVPGYSPFINSVAYYVKDVMTQRQTPLTFSIIVSVRKDVHKEGNYIKLAIVNARYEDSTKQICSRIAEEIRKVRENTFVFNQVIMKDVIRNACIEYIFNSWRELSEIDNLDLNLDLKLKENMIGKEEMEQIKKPGSAKMMVMTYSSERKQFIIHNCIRMAEYILSTGFIS